MPETNSPHQPGKAIAFKLSAMAVFSVMAAMVKAATTEIPAGEVVFFRAFFSIPVILGWLILRGELTRGLVTRNIRGHFLRSLIGAVSMGLSFGGLSLLPLPEVTAIGYATPIFTLILSALILGERFRMIRLSAVGIGLVGVVVMLWPRLGGAGSLEEGATLGAILVLTSTFTGAMAQIQIRQLVQTEHTAAVVFYFMSFTSILALFTIPFGWVMPSGEMLALLIGAGLVGGVGQALMTTSYRYAQASMLAPFDYTSMIFAIILGYLWFSELPALVTLAGAALVVLGNVVVILRERQLGIERRRARSVGDPKG
ncbi:MAG: DMT family transporter [Pseudooceanicola sp.]|nr:DMT family transporter [Pseudooceanicola sp.]